MQKSKVIINPKIIASNDIKQLQHQVNYITSKISKVTSTLVISDVTK